MVGRYSVALSPRLAPLLLLLVSYFSPGETVVCYSCSYTYTEQHLGYECVNDTEEVKTAKIVNCGGPCRDLVVYKRHENNEFVVSSVDRSCMRTQHTGPNCTESQHDITCTFICKGTKCNNWDLAYREPPESSTMTLFPHWTFASVALTTLLLNLIF